MKKIILVAIFFCLQSCVAQNVFEEGEYIAPKEPILICTVDAIQDDTAWIYTRKFKVEYQVDAKGLELHKEYLLSLFVEPGSGPRGGKAKIRWFTVTPEQARKDAREKVKNSKI